MDFGFEFFFLLVLIVVSLNAFLKKIRFKKKKIYHHKEIVSLMENLTRVCLLQVETL